MRAEEYLENVNIKTNTYIDMGEHDTIYLPYLMERFKATCDLLELQRWLENLLDDEWYPKMHKANIQEDYYSALKYKHYREVGILINKKINEILA